MVATKPIVKALEADQSYEVNSYGPVGFSNPKDSGATATITINNGSIIILEEDRSISVGSVNGINEVVAEVEYSSTPTRPTVMLHNEIVNDKNC